jgi:hypothetical protein
VTTARHSVEGALVGGRYRLRRRLSEDATAVAWEALDIKLERSVLLKLLRAELVDDVDLAEDFRRETRTLARTTATSSARVLDAGEDQASRAPFVVFAWTEDLPSAPPSGPSNQPTTRLVVPTPRPSRAGRRMPSAQARLLVVPLLAVPLVIGALVINSWVSQPESPVRRVFSLAAATQLAAPAAESTRAATPAPASVARAPTSTAPRAAATPTPAPQTGERRRIANTDGIGVALRASPGGDRLPGKGYDEGVTVTLLEQQGTWARIRGDDGREGWVLAVTLVR